MFAYAYMQVMNILVVPVYTLITASALSTLVSSYLYSLSLYGKLCSPPSLTNDASTATATPPKNMNILQWIQSHQVNKQWFTHFYVFGLLNSAWIFWNIVSPGHSSGQNSLPFAELLLWMLLLVHLSRRLYECTYVHVWGTSKMNIAAYVIGMVYYVMLPFVFIPSTHPALRMNCSTNGNDSSTASCSASVNGFGFITDNDTIRKLLIICGTALCIWSQYEQHLHHVILAKLRTSNSRPIPVTYRLPQGRWFQYVSSPHYLAEIMIYIGFILLQSCARNEAAESTHTSQVPNVFSSFIIQQADTTSSLNWYLSPIIQLLIHCSSTPYKVCALVSWIFVNLSISARRTHLWYQHQFGKFPDNPVRHRKALIPFVW